MPTHSSNQPKGAPVKLSVVVPLYNEEENVVDTAQRITRVIEPLNISWELILVDDGSTDGTRNLIEALAENQPHVRFISYQPNRGRGRALRTGFATALGKYIISTDADLSYDPAYMPIMIEILDRSEADMILASPYMPGGCTQGVPLIRLWISRIGNWILRHSLPAKINTVTCVFRAYRREVLNLMELESDGKEIHLEILSKALAVGWEIKEIPAVLTNRKRGESTFRFRRTAFSHLVFSFLEKPILLFGLMGLIMTLFGVAVGIYLFTLYLQGNLNPSRPFMSLMALFILAGLFMFSFGLLALKISHLRKDIYRIQKENLELKQWLKERLIASQAFDKQA
jgi:glycosyltransferase involved in cell wall biosynthesis